MKKILVLTLVLGLVSLASAGLSLVPSGEVPASGSLAIDFTAADGSMLGYDMAIEVTSGIATLSDAVLSTTGSWFVAPAIVVDSGSAIRITAGGFPGFANGLEVDDVVLTINYVGEKDAVISLVNYETTIGGEAVPTGILESATIVPEPATMALLGLGALVLRRKK